MAFCFKRKESVAKAVRRLGGERIESALESLEECGHAEAIHCARKDIKRLRALLRMVRTNISGKKFCRVTKLLRAAAGHLALPRDAYVKAKTLKSLVGHFKGKLAPGALRHVRSELRSDFDKEMKRFAEEKKVKSVERLLSRLASEFEGLEVRDKGWNAIGPNVKAAYSGGRRAWQEAQVQQSPEHFHEWRKRTKDLWYQVTLLRPIWPEQMDAMADELETLSEYLGDDHDLWVLQQSVQELFVRTTGGRELEILRGLIEGRHQELRAASISLGKRFYQEKPSPFCKRLAGYWHTWRREKNPCGRPAAAGS